MNNKNSVDKKSIFKHVKCDFCNSYKYQILIKTKDYHFEKIPGEFTIVKCLGCNLVYSNPRLKSIELKRYYSNIVTYDNRPPDLRQNNRIYSPFSKEFLTYFFNYPFLKKKKKIRKLILLPKYIRFKRKWKKSYNIPSYIENGRILEVGCSYGGFLILLKKLGWIVKGLELNKEAIKFAINQLKLDVEYSSIEDFQSDDLFDIIYLQMVLEHLESPKKVLLKCFQLLKSSGKLVLTVPDFSGIELRLYKKYAYTLQLPYHLYHFTPNSIKNYLKRLNFTKIKFFHQSTTKDFIMPLTYIFRDKPNDTFIRYMLKLGKFNLIRNSLIKFLSYILTLLGKTSRMTVIAIK